MGKSDTARHDNNDSDRHSETEDHPFGLLALQGTGHPPVAVELDERKRRQLAHEHEKEADSAAYSA